MAELEIQLTSVSHGATFLFAIYQLSKGCEYTVNMYIAYWFFCENFGTEFTNLTLGGKTL